MDWEAFTRLPSRLSAELVAETQNQRNGLLNAALAKGLIADYAGIRISSTGRRFEISDTILWNVTDDAAIRHGQAAMIGAWHYL